MLNPNNVCNCEECPMNEGFEAWPETRKPCGQFNCWVELNCNRMENEEDYYEDEDY